MEKDNGLTAQATGLSLIAQERDVVKGADWFVSEIRERIAEREEMRSNVLGDIGDPETEEADWERVFGLEAEIGFLRGLLVRSGHELNQPRGLSASEAPTSAEAVTPTPSEDIP
jgi:hypothetical protein